MMVAPEIQPHRSRERHGEYRQGKIYGFIRAAQENQGFGSREDGHPPVRKEERGNSQQRQLGLGQDGGADRAAAARGGGNDDFESGGFLRRGDREVGRRPAPVVLHVGRFSLGSGTGIQNGAGARGSGGSERLSVGDRDGCASALGCLHMNAQD
jgi:hypothetical protein